jgi:glycine/D-amino acid oxidase-like deaminating enzyme
MKHSRITIVGAGIAGLMCAWRLLAAGHKVAVLEKGDVGKGASGGALGLLMPFHPGVNGQMAKVQRASVAQWPLLARRLAAELGVDADGFYRTHTEGAQVNVPVVLELLAQAVETRGGVIVEGVEVENVAPLKPECDGILLAAGVGNARWLPGIRGIAGQAVRLRPVRPLTAMLRDDSFYVAPDWDGTVLVGSHTHEGSRAGPDPAVTAELVAKAEALCPALKGAEIAAAWAADRPTCKPLLPLVRPVEDRAWAVTGLGKLGFCLAPAVADAAAEVFG